MATVASVVNALATFYQTSEDPHDPDARAAVDHPAARQAAHRGGLRLQEVDRPAVPLPRQLARPHRELPADDVRGAVGAVRGEPHDRARAQAAADPARRPRAELLDVDRAAGRLVRREHLRVDRGRRRRALGPAARRREPGRDRDARGHPRQRRRRAAPRSRGPRIPTTTSASRASVTACTRTTTRGPASSAARPSGCSPISTPRTRSSTSRWSSSRSRSPTTTSSRRSCTRTSTSTRASSTGRWASPPTMFPVLFAIGRLPGWLAHWKEAHENAEDQDRAPAPDLHRPHRAQVRRARTAHVTRPDGSRRLAGRLRLASGPGRADSVGRMAFSPVASPARDVERMERCVAAARELATETSSAAFTVAQIAARAGLSLKSFYRCFPGKDELLLALLEDDSHIGARVLAQRIGTRDEPRGRAARVRHRALRADRRTRARSATRACSCASTAGSPSTTRSSCASRSRRSSSCSPSTSRPRPTSTDPRRDAETMFRVLLQGIDDVVVGRVDRRGASTPSTSGASAGGLRLRSADGRQRQGDASPAPGVQGGEDAHRRRRSCPSPSRATAHYTIISVDDHLIEPAHLFEGRMPAALADRAPQRRHARRRPRDLGLRGRLLPAGRAQRGRRPPEGRVEHGAGALRRDAARLLRHRSARRRHGPRRRVRHAVLPVADRRASRARSSPSSKDPELGLACAAGVERLAHRGVGRPASRSHHPVAARVAAAIPRSRRPTCAATPSAASRP